MTDEDLLSTIVRVAAADEGYELRHFGVVRNGRELRVTLLDHGRAAGAQRYMVEVTDVDEVDLDAPHSLSNPSGTVADALAGVHWNEFNTRR